jgi:hypothetical protein
VFTKRVGPLSDAEKTIVEQFASDQPCEVTQEQIKTLAKLMRRSPKAIREHLECAREAFACHAQTYVEIHREATERALASGTSQGLEVARRACEWAMENL